MSATVLPDRDIIMNKTVGVEKNNKKMSRVQCRIATLGAELGLKGILMLAMLLYSTA